MRASRMLSGIVVLIGLLVAVSCGGDEDDSAAPRDDGGAAGDTSSDGGSGGNTGGSSGTGSSTGGGSGTGTSGEAGMAGGGSCGTAGAAGSEEGGAAGGKGGVGGAGGPGGQAGTTVTAGAAGSEGGAAGSKGGVGGAGGPGGQAGTAGSAGDTVAAGRAGAGGGGGNAGGGGADPCQPTACSGVVRACGDCADDDGDNLVDAADPDCLSPCDESEDSLQVVESSGTAAPCQLDCFFDHNDTSGDDDCHWDHRCDPLETAPNYPPEGSACEYDPEVYPAPGMTCMEAMAEAGQSLTCYSTCLPLVPNGCDCFGCCDYPGVPYPIWLGSVDTDANATCTRDNVNDPTLCKPCTFVPGCANECDPCELCVGKTELPPECTSNQTCAPGTEQCGLPGQASCPAGFFCLTGCCAPVP